MEEEEEEETIITGDLEVLGFWTPWEE